MTKPALPELNVGLLTDIVTWAAEDAVRRGEAGDDALRATLFPKAHAAGRFAEWGRWNQGLWGQVERNGHCKTAFCMAGQTVAQAEGLYPIFTLRDTLGQTKTYETDQVTTVAPPAVEVTTGPQKGSQRVPRAWYVENFYDLPAEVQASARSVSTNACTLLGIVDGFPERTFFSGGNNIEMIVKYAAQFAAVRGITLDLEEWITDLIEGWPFDRPLLDARDWSYDWELPVSLDEATSLYYANIRKPEPARVA